MLHPVQEVKSLSSLQGTQVPHAKSCRMEGKERCRDTQYWWGRRRVVWRFGLLMHFIYTVIVSSKQKQKLLNPLPPHYNGRSAYCVGNLQ